MTMAIRTAGVYSALTFMIGIMLPFLPVWLKAVGLTNQELAALLAAQSLVRVAAAPLVAYLADKMQARRRFLIAIAWVSFVACAGMVVADGFAALTVLVVISAAGWSPIMPMLDTIAVEQSEAGHYDYGRVRVAASASFIAGSVFAGLMLTVIPHTELIWLLVGAFAVLAAATPLLPRLGASHHAGAEPITLRRAGRVLGASAFVLLVVAAGLAQSSHALYYGFSSVHWTGIGYSPGLIGTLWAVAVIAEIVLFMLTRRVVARLGPVRLIMAGAAAGAVRWLAMTLDPPVAALFAIQCLHAFSYGATHLGTMYFIRQRIDPALAGTAQGLFVAISGGIMMTAAMSWSGHLYEGHRAGGYVGMAGLCAVAFVVATVLRRRWRGVTVSEPAEPARP